MNIDQALGWIGPALELVILGALILEGKKIMSQLDDLKAQVEQNASVEASAAQLIQGLADKLQAALDGAANSAQQAEAIAGVIAELRTSGDALAAAVAANTNVGQPPPAPPAPPADPGSADPGTGVDAPAPRARRS